MDFAEITKILRETHNCFIAMNVEGGIRFGVKTVGIIKQSNNQEVIDRAIEVSKIEDEDDFEDEVTELFSIGTTSNINLPI